MTDREWQDRMADLQRQLSKAVMAEEEIRREIKRLMNGPTDTD